MTGIVRFFLVLLFLALPLSLFFFEREGASASVPAAAASGMGCHDTVAHTPTEMTPTLATTPSHDAHASAHWQHQVSAERTHADCDCAMKCGCLQHCATSGLMAQSAWGMLIPALPVFVATAVATDLPSTRISSLFRPPIAALS